ncbi:MAG TPA: C1 family peptidase, partial [Phycisphaerae bacterium]|nr:C1 family peptidase [Phycisphaerae bacterium]
MTVTDSLGKTATASIDVTVESPGLGAIRLEERLYDSVPLATIPGVAGNLPTSVDLSPDMPPAGNQGSQGSCVGWAVGYGLKGYQERVEKRWDQRLSNHQFSPGFLYNRVKPDCNCLKGTTVSDALNLLSQRGICTLDLWPYDQTDCCPRSGTSQLDSAAWPYRIAYWRRVNFVDTSEMKAHLADKKPLIWTMKAYSSFTELWGPTRAVYDRTTTTMRGYHAVVVAGYQDSTSRFKVLNSWGPEFGSDGYFFVPYSFVNSIVVECYAAQDLIETAPLAVSPSATPRTISPGQQSNLLAGASGGTSPYNYFWSPATGLSGRAIEDPVASPAQTTDYTITVTDANGAQASASVRVTVNSLAAPTNVQATDGTYSDKVVVTWNLVSGAEGYDVWRNASDNSAGAVKIFSTSASRNYGDDKAVTTGTTYWYWVKAVTYDPVVTSEFSVPDSGYTSASLEPPTGVLATDGTCSDKVVVTWNLVSGAEGYD